MPNRGSPQPPRLRPRSLVLIKTGARPLRSCRPGPRCRSGPFGAAGEALGCQQLSRGVKRGGGRLHSGVRSPPRSHSAPPRLAPSSDVHRGVTHLAAGATPVRAPTGPWGCWCLPPPQCQGFITWPALIIHPHRATPWLLGAGGQDGDRGRTPRCTPPQPVPQKAGGTHAPIAPASCPLPSPRRSRTRCPPRPALLQSRACPLHQRPSLCRVSALSLVQGWGWGDPHPGVRRPLLS